MERRADDELSEDGRRSHSGVFRAVDPQVLAQLALDVRAATARAEAFRARLGARFGAQGPAAPVEDDNLTELALQEIDTAHEELRIAEEELHAQADELLSARAQLDRERRIYGELFEAAPDAYLVTDDRGVILQANRRAALLLNLDQALLPGKPMIALIERADRATFFNLLEVVGDAVFRAELRVRPRQHDPLWISLSAQRGVRDESSICIRWILRDVARDKEEERALHSRVRELEQTVATLTKRAADERASREQAEQSARQQGQALAEAAHELRSPLGTVAGWLRIMSEEQLAESVHMRAVSSMARAVRGMVRIVEDLIDHTRFDHGQVVLKTGTINLVSLAIEVIQDVQPLAALKKLQIKLSAKSHRLEVQGDPWRLTQVLKNLIGNAIKFTPEQGTIYVDVAIVGAHAEVSITDTGRGIPPDALLKIFAPFSQLGAPGTRHTGLGLGLSIAQRLVQLHGGTIRAKSNGVGTGATFTVRLPRLAPN